MSHIHDIIINNATPGTVEVIYPPNKTAINIHCDAQPGKKILFVWASGPSMEDKITVFRATRVEASDEVMTHDLFCYDKDYSRFKAEINSALGQAELIV